MTTLVTAQTYCGQSSRIRLPSLDRELTTGAYPYLANRRGDFMCDDPACTSIEPPYAITPQTPTGTIPLRLVGEFSGSHQVPPAGCGYYAGIALKKLFEHPDANLAEIGASRREVYEARENFLINHLRRITPPDRMLTHRHRYPLMFGDAVGFLASLGVGGYTHHSLQPSTITPGNVCQHIHAYIRQHTTRGLMVGHMLSGGNAHWISILRSTDPNGFLVYDSCGAGGLSDHVGLVSPAEMSRFYGPFPWTHIIAPS